MCFQYKFMPTEPELVGEGEESLETAQSSDTALSVLVPEEPSNARLALILGCMWVSGTWWIWIKSRFKLVFYSRLVLFLQRLVCSSTPKKSRDRNYWQVLTICCRFHHRSHTPLTNFDILQFLRLSSLARVCVSHRPSCITTALWSPHRDLWSTGWTHCRQ